MGFWSQLFSSIVEDLTSGPKPTNRPEQPLRHTQSSRSVNSAGYSPGDVLSGTVDYVAEKFAKVVSGNLTAVVFLSEIADTRLSAAADVLKVGQSVDFVLQKNDPRGWRASINAVPEALIRQALISIDEGELVTGRVLELKERGAVIDAGGFKAWIPLAELAWEWIEHPADVVTLGEIVEIKIIRLEMPDGWLLNKRQRKAQAIASLRACVPQPTSPDIRAAFSGVPFKVWAVAKTPRSFDAVTSFVLQEMAEGKDREMISATTGLDLATLDDIQTFLVDESLTSNWALSRRGRELVEAMALARDLNNDPVRGMYASAAPTAAQLISLNEHRKQQALPRGWPRPPYNKRAEDEFVRATDEALPEAILAKLVSDEQRNRLTCLMEDSRIRVFLRRDGSSPWKAAFIDVPEHWLLAGLWHAFKPYSGRPYRPEKGAARCQSFLLVRCRVASAESESGPVETVYFEPNTRTLWYWEGEQRLSIKDLRSERFPDLPVAVHKNVASGAEPVIVELQPESWCRVRVF